MQFDARAKIILPIEDLLTVTTAKPSLAFRDKLMALPIARTLVLPGVFGRYIFKNNSHSLVSQTAALADQSGFIVAEYPNSWTAIEPRRECWRTAPGAHFRWHTRTLPPNTDDNPTYEPLFCIEYVYALTNLEVQSQQNFDGWRVDLATDRDNLIATYTHKPLVTFSIRTNHL